MRRTIKKMQVVVMATQGFSSAAEAVSFPARRTGSYFTPLSLVQSDIQVTDMLPAATRNRHTGQIIDFPETVQPHARLLVSPVLRFSTT